MIQKAHSAQKPRTQRRLSYNKWIHLNLQQIANQSRGRIYYISRTGFGLHKYQTSEVIENIHSLDLAKATPVKATLTSFGEKVCGMGGWIPYLRSEQKKKIAHQKRINIQDELSVKLSKMQIENLEYQKKIRTLEEQLKVLELLKKYWWLLGVTFTLGVILSNIL